MTSIPTDPSGGVRRAFGAGTLAALPFMIVVVPFALVFGVVADEAGLSLPQIMGFSILVLAGASQITAVQLLADGASLIVVLASALAVNLRMAMYSAALTPWIGRAPAWARALAAEGGEPLATALVVNMLDQRVLKLTPAFMTYSLAKHGLWAFTRTAAQALAPRIRVNGIAPGPTMQGTRQPDDHFARQRAGTILGRGADADDVVAALLYLRDARSVTGQMICTDGGQHLQWRTRDIIGVG